MPGEVSRPRPRSRRAVRALSASGRRRAGRASGPPWTRARIPPPSPHALVLLPCVAGSCRRACEDLDDTSCPSETTCIGLDIGGEDLGFWCSW